MGCRYADRHGGTTSRGFNYGSDGAVMAILEDSYWPAGSITSALTIGGTWSKAAQSITTGGDEDYDITSIGLCLKPTAAGCGTVHVELYAADGDGFPAGAVLSSGTVAEDDINVQTIPAPPAETVIAMGSYTINKNTAYVIVMYPDEIGGGPPAHGI